MPDITLYTTPTCPDCRALKAYLDHLGLSYEERDLLDPAVADEAKRRYGVRIAPIAVVDEAVFFGTFAEIRPRLASLVTASGEGAPR